MCLQIELFLKLLVFQRVSSPISLFSQQFIWNSQGLCGSLYKDMVHSTQPEEGKEGKEQRTGPGRNRLPRLALQDWNHHPILGFNLLIWEWSRWWRNWIRQHLRFFPLWNFCLTSLTRWLNSQNASLLIQQVRASLYGCAEDQTLCLCGCMCLHEALSFQWRDQDGFPWSWSKGLEYTISHSLKIFSEFFFLEIKA